MLNKLPYRFSACVLLVVGATWASVAQDSKSAPAADSSAMEQKARMELFIFARFHAIEGKEDIVSSDLRATVSRVRSEPGCLSIEVFRSVRDSRLFFLHSRWVDEAAFDKHAELPETNQFVERMQRLIDHPFDVTRTRLLE